MYKRNSQGWAKHFDFVLVDEIILQLAFLIAYYFRHGSWPYSNPSYRMIGIVLILIDLGVTILFNTFHNVLKRGLLVELLKTIEQCALVFGITIVFLFAAHVGDSFSRIALFLTALLHIVFGYGARLLWKWIVLHLGISTDRKGTLLVILSEGSAETMIRRLQTHNLEGYRIVGCVVNGDSDRKDVLGVPVVSTIEQAASYICQEWIDGVYIDAPSEDPNIAALIDACHEMAVPVHYHIASITRESAKQFAERIGGTTVLTSSFNYASSSQLAIKRCLDILGGIVGSVLALIIMLIVGPMIKKASPGPILYAQERIGKNGKHFRILKIRSMHQNADAMKQKLMEQNRVKDGMMFKMDFDPRIIGNEILPDGTRKTGIGEFIRRTSLDEFPQFFNVLAGQMSLVGTRPPTVDEWEKYEYHHRARLACKPGITGMWQVSGRSEITDFEEVVKLDTEYISNWSIGLDIKILLKTIGVLFTGRGAM